MSLFRTYKPKFTYLLILLFVVQLVLSACLPDQTGVSTTIEPSETVLPSETEISGGRPEHPSGVLRLWWPQRSSFNPLADNSRAGQAVYDLIFQGLFRIASDQSLTSELAEKIVFAQNDLLAIITLRRNQYFHDGTLITAQDVAACIDYLLAQESGLGKTLNLQMINQVEIVDEWTIHLALDNPHPWLAYSLTFPIVPADSLMTDNHELIAGSGSYRMSSYQPQEGLWLELADDSDDISALESILVKSYPDQKRAMQAFETDEIDLVWLSAPEYMRYSRRSDIRAQSYTGDRLLLIAMNTSDNRPLAHPEQLLFIKQMIDSHELLSDDWLKYGQPVSVPLPENSFLLENISTDTRQLLLEPGEASWQNEEANLEIILPDNCQIRDMLASWLSDKLDKAEIKNEIHKLMPEDFWKAIEAGAYDIAFLETVMPVSPDPLFILGEQQNLVPLVRQSITGYDEYQVWQGLLHDIWNRPPEQMLAAEDLALVLKHTTSQSPFIFLMIRSEVLLKGDRIRGQSSPSRYQPYEGIEELWVWSSQ